MKKIILAFAMAIALIVTSIGAEVEPTGIVAEVTGVEAEVAEAGSSCYQPARSRSGNYVTWSSYGSGSGWHRVVVVQGGHTMYGAWKWGSGRSYRTIYAPSYAGVAYCQLR